MGGADSDSPFPPFAWPLRTSDRGPPRAGRAGSLAFAGALRPRHLVHTLDLADNSFGDDGGDALTAWLADSGVAFTDNKPKFAIDAAFPATLRAVYTSDGFVDSITPDSGVVGLVLDQTTFFAQAGGQVPDVGRLLSVDIAPRGRERDRERGDALNVTVARVGAERFRDRSAGRGVREPSKVLAKVRREPGGEAEAPDGGLLA